MTSRATSLATAGASIAALASQPALRRFLLKWSGFNAPGGVWRILAILLALANLKNLPGVWHFRFFRAFFYHLHFQPTPIPPHALFQPVITSSRTTLLETDYNLHKSNSTYFSDMDVSRTHLFTAIIRSAILKDKKKNKSVTFGASATQGTKGRHIIALGGISCLFKKEILPYRKYEMWTRLLCWDRKWFYLVTHLVKPGVARPKSWTLQPWRKTTTADGVDAEKLKSAIFATAIAKYVIKKGRITVPPEQVLLDAEMVPVKPEGWVYDGDDNEANGGLNGSTESFVPKVVGEGEWTWDVIEKERLKGSKFAEHFAAMDGLHDVFDGGKEGVMGEYADLLF
ncbi:hypothetical protein BDV95DRAFT_533544 [Massariosphaeria phaeospora]|uniref:Capsule polysaccharide biosynthesis protein n=1 Tax=Massariosphaeria phaeospora TaxID=100035 RepID=A0A7C8IJT7_9PLEO|nr:hypothetical protein BDV95DRAFT_533544 [Massariosphaeria phaeospora]